MSSDLKPEKNHSLEDFQEEEKLLFFNCDRCDERHPVGEDPHREEVEK